MLIYPPNASNQVVMELEDQENGMVIDFDDEDSAILFFEFMKQVKIEAEK